MRLATLIALQDDNLGHPITFTKVTKTLPEKSYELSWEQGHVGF